MAIIDHMNLLTIKTLAAKLECSESLIWQIRQRDPTFPRPFSIGVGTERSRAARWDEQDIDAWLQTRKTTTQGDHLDEHPTSDVGEVVG